MIRERFGPLPIASRQALIDSRCQTRPTGGSGATRPFAMGAVLRTPDVGFEGRVDFPFGPGYVEVDGLGVAWFEAGPADGPVVLCLHGEPTWSYLYRSMLPAFAAAG